MKLAQLIRITQRQSVLGVLILLTAGLFLIWLSMLLGLSNEQAWVLTLASGGMFFLTLGLLIAYWRGWEPARYITVVLATLVTGAVTQEPFVTQVPSLTLFTPPALALILAGPEWVLGCAAALYLILLARAGGQGVYADPATFAIWLIAVGGMVVGRLVTNTAQRAAEEQARRAEAERARAEQQAQDLAEANQLLEQQLDQQNKLLDLVTTLETPAVALADGVLFAPIIGHIDTRRAQTLTARLLEEASTQRARHVILDVTGVTTMDTAVARALLGTVQSLRLLGCEVTLSGISANVAISLIHLGVDLDDVRTVRSPQEALARHLTSIVGRTPNN